MIYIPRERSTETGFREAYRKIIDVELHAKLIKCRERECNPIQTVEQRGIRWIEHGDGRKRPKCNSLGILHDAHLFTRSSRVNHINNRKIRTPV